jgi:hypothetical protein
MFHSKLFNFNRVFHVSFFQLGIGTKADFSGRAGPGKVRP